MGLDIAFDREQAIAAGIELKTERRGTDAQIDRVLEEIHEHGDPQDKDHLRFLQEEATLVRVPGMRDPGDGQPYWTEDNGGDGPNIVMRANRWGHTHRPLTLWLTQHNIEWRTF